MLDINKDNFEAEVLQSEQPVVIDLWGPKCSACLALMPDVEALAEEYAEKVKFGKINCMENRRLVVTLRVVGLPAFLFWSGGEQKEKITGEDVTVEDIRGGVERLISL
jgi:thioredoxin 1